MTEKELRKLHIRFGHPAADRLFKFLTHARYDDLDVDIISKSSKYSHQCQLYVGAPGCFHFTLHNDFEFDYRVIIDVMYFDSKPILHDIDEATAFQAAGFLRNITAKCTWATLRLMWIKCTWGLQM